jgi:hypothetical protein
MYLHYLIKDERAVQELQNLIIKYEIGRIAPLEREGEMLDSSSAEQINASSILKEKEKYCNVAL